MRVVSREIRERNWDPVSGETGLSPKCRTCRVRVCECALTSGQRKVSRTGIDGCSLPVERPANCPPTSLSSALLPKLFSDESIDTDTHPRISSLVPLLSAPLIFLRRHMFHSHIVNGRFIVSIVFRILSLFMQK